MYNSLVDVSVIHRLLVAAERLIISHCYVMPKINAKNIAPLFLKTDIQKNAPTMVIECKGIEVKEGKKQWGAPNYRVFAIKLSKIIETKNCELSSN